MAAFRQEKRRLCASESAGIRLSAQILRQHYSPSRLIRPPPLDPSDPLERELPDERPVDVPDDLDDVPDDPDDEEDPPLERDPPEDPSL